MMAGTYIFLSSIYFSIAVNSLALGLMAICWLCLMVVERRWGVLPTALDYFFLAYVAVEMIATAFSQNPSQSLFFSRRVLLIGIVYFFAGNLRSPGEIRNAVAVLAGTAAAVALLGTLKLVFGNPEENIRLSIFQFYMTTSELMLAAGLFILSFVVHGSTPPRVRFAALLALIPILIALYATVTRGAYLAFAAGALFIALVRNKKLLIPLAILLVVMILFAPPYIENRIRSIIDLNHPENVSRLMMWTAGIRIFLDHPVFGVGDIDLGELMRQHADPGYPGVWGHQHNVAMQILVTLGSVGFLVVAAMFVAIMVAEWRIYRRVSRDWLGGSVVLGAMAVFVGFQVNGLTEWTFGDQEMAVLFWATVGLALAVGRIAEDQGRALPAMEA
jgi:putative inorganic carbon (HCO3(-)) transporter